MELFLSIYHAFHGIIATDISNWKPIIIIMKLSVWCLPHLGRGCGFLHFCESKAGKKLVVFSKYFFYYYFIFLQDLSFLKIFVMWGFGTELKIWQSLGVLGQGCDCHSNENLSEAQNKFLFVFIREKLKLSRLLCRTLQLLDVLTWMVTTGTLQLQYSLRFCRLAQSNRVSDMNAQDQEAMGE